MTAARTPSEILVGELQAARGRKGWTQRQLADRLEELGAPLDRSTIAKVESGKRGVLLDEVFWFAVALDVSPPALVLPRDAEPVQLAPALEAGSWEALQWFRGLYPLAATDAAESPVDSPAVRFFYEACPDYEAETIRRFPGVRDIWFLASLAMTYGSGDERLESLERVLIHMREDLAAEIRKVRRRKEASDGPR
jgi:transcriptional regulator with XRE-family HTH domain